MTNPIYNLFLGIGVVFGFLASLIAYLITYNEWMHHYPTKKEPRKMAFKAAIFTFIVFFVLTLISGYFLSNFQ